MDANVYVVKQRWLSGRGKKIWESGDIVQPSDFPNNFDQLISEGRISLKETIKEQVTEKVSEIIIEKKNNVESIEEDIEYIVINRNGENITIFEDEDCTKKELIQYLSNKEIDFNPLDKKEILWNLAIKK